MSQIVQEHDVRAGRLIPGSGLDRVKFFRRRQFALGPEYFDFPGWRRVRIAEGCLLTVHPDLQVTTIEKGPGSMTLLGYVIDPYAPDSRESEILDRMLEESAGIPDVIDRLECLTGRFVLIVKIRDELWLFHDAVALRQVQYCKHTDGSIWCASQAETLAERLGFSPDEEVLNYRNIPAFQQRKTEFWLLNDRTPYREVSNLLPNHSLDLRRGQSFRYWPRKGCIPRLSMEESIRSCTPILVNTIKAASERFDLRMGISAGIDSRKTLACTRSVSQRICYFSHGTSEDTLNVSDVTVPARLLPKLGLKHHALPLRPMSDEFKELYGASSTWARDKKGKNAFTLLSEFGPEITVLNSNISEVAQCIYWLPRSHIDGTGLATISGLCHPFAIAEFQKWLDGAKPACQDAGFDILALFFVEQRMGRWATAAFCEYDIAHETFNPYNNRRLHSLMLGVSQRHRRDRMWDVSIRHIKSLWPEVLAEPINPQDSLRARVQQSIRRYVVHKTIASWCPLYPYLRYLKKRRRFRKQQSGSGC